MNVQTYLYFAGSCSQALEVYQRALGAKVLYLAHFSDAPEALRLPGRETLVFHATLQIGETLINLSDDPNFDKGSFGGFALLVHLDSSAAVDAAASVLAEGGAIQLDPTEVPWAYRYGIVTDRFGVTWKLQHSPT